MKKIKNLTLGILGATILSLGLYACSNDNEATTNTTSEQKNVLAFKSNETYEKEILFEKIKKEFSANSDLKLVNVDNEAPEFLEKYLDEAQITNFRPFHVEHITVDTNNELETLDVYSLQSSTDQFNYLIVIENKYFDYNFIIDANIEFNGEAISMKSNKIYQVTNKKHDPKYGFDSKLFYKCMEAHMGSKLLWGLGVAGGFGCGPCAFVAGVYSVAGAAVCAGAAITYK